MALMRESPLDFITGLARTYGDITRHRADGDTVYLLNRPEYARHVLKDNGANYTKEGTPDDAMLRPLLGNGLLTSNGADWARQRHLTAPAFRPSAVRTFDTIVTDATAGMLERWRPSVEAGTPLEVDQHFTALTLGILTHAILGADIDGIGEGFGRAVDAVNRCIGHYVPNPDPDPADTARRYADFGRARVFLNTVTRTLIASRRAGGGSTAGSGTRGGDLLDTMMSGHHLVSDEDLRDQVLTIVMAGHETTAKSLTWTLYLLDRHPEELAKVREEVDRVLGGRPPTAADLQDLPACRRAIQEAMRLYPPVWLISRRAAGPDVIGGYDVEPGTLVCVSQWVLHRHPEYWTEPDAYRPDRFDGADLPSHLYLPFGGGDRICVGQHFAMLEAVLVLASLLQSVRLELVEGFPVEPEALVTLRPKHGMTMIARPR
ncbi:cytochrome P450 [Kitasatospora cathayae]|uniref:Cytochrome P450 n=1 Tax=Kitasatospora cathayae TaxID=3004092 RepID=A0ABY7Q4R2_9ACTN|nr:cytochrome P450 [Kitasatospora sp. HUAS 3-15]WBP87629.1 cytochrome P450 [Kitasatospora sp. HUAS 3-15]